MRFLSLLLFSFAVAVPQQHHGLRRAQKELYNNNEDDDCTATFQELDADHNGYLTKSDLATVLSGSMSPKEIDNYLYEVEADSSITMAAFCKGKTTKEANYNHEAEEETAKIKDSDCQALFNGMDSNGDGSLDRNDIEIALEEYASKTKTDLDALVNEFFSSVDSDVMNFNDFGQEYCTEATTPVRAKNSHQIQAGKVPYENCITVYKELDANNDRQVDSSEIQNVVNYGVPASSINTANAPYQYIDFREEYCGEPPPPTPAPTDRPGVNYRNGNAPSGKIASEDCRDVFQQLDWYNDGHVDCWDIQSLEKDYGIPKADIDYAEREYAKSSEDGQVQMNYNQFRDNFCG